MPRKISLASACLALFLSVPLGAVAAKNSDAPIGQVDPEIGGVVPAVSVETTQGRMAIPGDFKSKWVLWLAYPNDFSPVAATELLTLATMVPEFKALNCELLAQSPDTLSNHIAWMRSLQEKVIYKNMKGVGVTFPLIADPLGEAARAYGLPLGQEGRAAAAVLIIDPKCRLRARMVYPGSVGFNFMEIKRLLIALQTADAYGVETPSDWQPGEDVALPPPASLNAAKDRQANPGKDAYSLEWYLNLKKLGRDSVPPAPIKKER